MLGHPVAGLDTRADPHRLTPADELAARTAGRHVVALLHGRLIPRHTWDIHAGRTDRPALAVHDCRRWPTTQPPDPSLLTPAARDIPCTCTREDPCF